MKGQDELYQLIKTLTPSEKRYFKVNASKGGDAKSNYMQLFEAMDKQKEEYDEELLKRKNAKKPFIKYLSAEKKQLREQILKYMRAFHSGRTVDNQINELLQDELFFRDKGLKHLREKTIHKAKELATSNERFYLLQEVLEREIAFVGEFEDKKLEKPVLDIITELLNLSVKHRTFIELLSKNKEIFSIFRSGNDIKHEKVRLRLKTLISEVENLRPEIENSFRLQREFFRAYSNYNNTINEHDKSYEFDLAELKLFETFPQFKEQDRMMYKICLANLISRAHSSDRKEEFVYYVNLLKSLPTSTFNEEGEVFQNVFFLEHLHYMNIGDFRKAESLVPGIESGLTKYQDKINKARHLSFLYNIMVMYFLMHRFKEASIWANKILEDKSEIKQEVTLVTRILLPVIHFELGHHDVVESLTRSAYRFLKKKERIHSFERLLLNYLNTMPFSEKSEEFESNLRQFYGQLELIYNDPKTQNTVGMEEIKLWANSKFSGVKMAEQLNSSN